MNHNDVIENIGAYIRYLRIQNGMTQEELANGICSVPYLSKVENNRLIPSEEIVNLLLKKLGIQIKEIDHFVHTFRQKLTEGNYAIKIKDRKSATKVFEEIKNYEQQIIHFPQVLWDFYLFLLKYFLFIKEEITESKKIIRTIENIKNQLNTQQKMSFYHLKGVYCCLNKNYEEGLILLKKAQVYMEQTKEFNPELYYHLGLTYSYLNNIILAINYSTIALNHFNESANYLRSLDCQIILGINYLRIEEYEKSQFYFNNVHNIIDTFDIKDLKGTILHNLGYLYFKKKEYQNAIEYFLQSLNHKNENNINYSAFAVQNLV
jgi:transcriptional regulator with XRE-family HTH domain